MANAESPVVTAKVAVKPKKKPAAPKKAASHPTYNDMVLEAIKTLNERSGSSRHAILVYIEKHHNVGDNPKKVNSSVKLSLKKGVKSNMLKQVKGSGASGSFRIGDAAATKKPAAKVSKPKSPASKQAPKTKKTPTKKTGAKKAVVKKSPAKPPAVKKAPVKKSPAKKPAAKKPAAKKPAAKKLVAKKPAAKSKKPAAK